jgi:anoctamin-10
VTNQVVGAFLENVLPYILRFADDWRAGKTTIKQAVKRDGDKTPPRTDEEVEKKFMDKVDRELSLPDYNLFSQSTNNTVKGSMLTMQPTTPRWSLNLAT